MLNISILFINTVKLKVRYTYGSNVFGFLLIAMLTIQIISGILLSFSLLPEPMLTPIIRDEEDIEVPYIDLIFWAHERGVDSLFILFYYHFLKKTYLITLYVEQENTWKTGVIALLLFQVVTFLGLCLCCTHLSDITLGIACNIMHTFFNFKGKPYAFIFTDKKLNTDTLIRLAYAHYISAFVLLYIGIVHALIMHYDWKTDYNYDALKNELVWYDEIFALEIMTYIDFLVILYFVGVFLFNGPEALSYEIFMWGDVGAVVDVRYLGVAPHWYFRPFMAWLTVCPFHKIGIFGLLLFFALIYNQVALLKHNPFFVKINNNLVKGNDINYINTIFKLVTNIMFWFFFFALMYTTTFLPAGKYYQIVYGNIGMYAAYMFVLIYLYSRKLKNPLTFNLTLLRDAKLAL